MVWIDVLVVALLVPFPFVVWWLDECRERVCEDRVECVRRQASLLASALGDLLDDGDDPDVRVHALTTLWDFYESEVFE